MMPIGIRRSVKFVIMKRCSVKILVFFLVMLLVAVCVVNVNKSQGADWSRLEIGDWSRLEQIGADWAKSLPRYAKRVESKNNSQTTVNNVSLYIEDFLRKIEDPKKRKVERESLDKYNKERNAIMQLLPGLTKQNPRTTFHVLVDKTEKLLGVKYKLVVLVSSNAPHFDRRRNIWRLWANNANILNKNSKVFFIMMKLLCCYYVIMLSYFFTIYTASALAV